MSDTLVLVVTGLIALGVPLWTAWGMWRSIRHTPTRQGALANVLGSVAGTALLGVVLPAVLLGALDPFPIWLAYAALTVAAATVLAWHWPALRSGKWSQPSLVNATCLLLVVFATAGFAVT
ncbi:hypothetical protein DQ353_18525 [Arthrobacter sp. AQ5-05]|uniref:hypothetical protein n=1 Tax=Arthrobacter sp. AQ5-05 TaxID=2184581 RepID=UPI000DCCC8BA|nr:hypothetical protein [Arthrobacter sp. AQ5-05]RAX47769.1 hypothetical protein DQ353_18525 [Arthrobacter sp. AQ5-05]